MEIQHVTPISMKGSDCTPSLLYNNLSALGSFISYVHKNEIVCADVSNPEQPSIKQPLSHGQWKSKTALYQVKVFRHGACTVLAVATTASVQFWDADRDTLLCTTSAEDDKDVYLSRGLAVLPQKMAQSALVFVGHSNGKISVVDFQGATSVHVKTLVRHIDSISDICAGQVDGCGTLIASADVAGELVLWRDDLSEATRTTCPGDTLVSLGMSGPFVICAFGSGQIRLFDAAEATMYCEIAAHARWITAIALSPDGSTMASVSEDMLACFWKLPSKANGGKVQLAGYHLIKDWLLTGVQFLSDEHACVSAYDNDTVHLLKVPG